MFQNILSASLERGTSFQRQVAFTSEEEPQWRTIDIHTSQAEQWAKEWGL